MIPMNRSVNIGIISLLRGLEVYVRAILYLSWETPQVNYQKATSSKVFPPPRLQQGTTKQAVVKRNQFETRLPRRRIRRDASVKMNVMKRKGKKEAHERTQAVALVGKSV